MNCSKITLRFWCIVWDAQLVFKWTYLGLGHFHLDGANLQMQTHLVPKKMHQNLAVILQQFNYGKNIFIVLVPGVNAAKPLGEEQTSASFCLF